MLANILKFGGISCLFGGYYLLTQNRIALTNPHLGRMLSLIHQHRPQYAQKMFKIMLRLNIIERDGNLNKYVLKSGFDTQGEYIQEIRDLGFAGIEIGPTSYNPSLEEDAQMHLGVLNAVANICTFRSKGANDDFRIELSIAPNYEILKYTPYLLKQNLIGSLDNFANIQKRTEQQLVNQLNIAFDRSDYSLSSSQLQEVQRMIKDIKQTITKQITAFNQLHKAQLSINYPSYTKDRYVDWNRLFAYITRKESL